MKVLVSAFACEPNKGSEPGVGWNWVRQIARSHEVWVITRNANRSLIEAQPASELPKVHWIYFDLPGWARFSGQRFRTVFIYYYLWQIAIYFVARRVQARHSFDVVHHVTYCTFWLPSFLSFLPVPFIWGPVGGGESGPKHFYRSLGWRGRLFEYVRDAVRRLAELDPFVRATARRSAITLATTHETAERLRRVGARRVLILSQVGLAAEERAALEAVELKTTPPLRLISIGRLLPWKGFHMGIEAFAQLRRKFPHAEYWLIGSGPDRERLMRIARKHQVEVSIRFWGDLPRADVFTKLAECDVLIHPSLHDSGANVCVEAMAAGRPVICLNLGGPAVQVTNQTGFLISQTTVPGAVSAIAEALNQLATHPEHRLGMGKKAQARVNEFFSWERKGDDMMKLYRMVQTEQHPAVMNSAHIPDAGQRIADV